MGVMNFVFPITALYFGPFALALYWRSGRAAAGQTAQAGRTTQHEQAGARTSANWQQTAATDKPSWVTMAIEVSHCGAGCTLGDVIAEWRSMAWASPIARASPGTLSTSATTCSPSRLASSSNISRSRR